jgi:hypothetical protein
MSRVTDALLKPWDPNREPPKLDTDNPDFVYRPGYVPYVLWKKNGDCPGDDQITETARQTRSDEGAVIGFFRHREISGLDLCPLCGKVYHNHGQVTSKVELKDDRDVKYKGMVCPGTWLVVGDNYVNILSKEEAEKYGLKEE